MKVIVLHGAKKHELVIPGSATVSELKDKLKALTGVAAEAHRQRARVRRREA